MKKIKVTGNSGNEVKFYGLDNDNELRISGEDAQGDYNMVWIPEPKARKILVAIESKESYSAEGRGDRGIPYRISVSFHQVFVLAFARSTEIVSLFYLEAEETEKLQAFLRDILPIDKLEALKAVSSGEEITGAAARILLEGGYIERTSRYAVTEKGQEILDFID